MCVFREKEFLCEKRDVSTTFEMYSIRAFNTITVIYSWVYVNPDPNQRPQSSCNCHAHDGCKCAITYCIDVNSALSFAPTNTSTTPVFISNKTCINFQQHLYLFVGLLSADCSIVCTCRATFVLVAGHFVAKHFVKQTLSTV